MGRVFDVEVLRTTLSTRLGAALSAQLVLLAVAAGLLGWISARLSEASARMRAIAGTVGILFALGLAATWPVADHAGSGSQVPLALPVDIAHLSAMAVWLGGLVVLAGVVLSSAAPVEQGDAVKAVRRFSSVALYCVITLVVTGSYQAWRAVGTYPALVDTAYGRLLLVKIWAMSALIGLGYLARTVLADQRFGQASRKKQRDQTAALMSQLRRTVCVEVGVGACVLIVTAALVNAPPARSAFNWPVNATAVFDTGGPSGSGLVQVNVDPAKAGIDTILVTVLGSSGSPEVVPEVRASLTLPVRSLGPLTVSMDEAGLGRYSGDVLIPMAGAWQLALVVRTSEVDETTVTIAVKIR